jgi:hypothetical protein
MIFNVLNDGSSHLCSCGGNMVRIEEISQTERDQCENPDTYVCSICGVYRLVDEDVFLERIDTVMGYV